jgi:citrate synthase
LLLYGALPSAPELKKFEETVVGEMMVNEKLIEFFKGFKTEAHPMAIMVGVVGALSAFLHSDYNVENPADRYQLSIKLIAKMPTLAAYTYRTAMGLPIVYPKKKFGYMKNFLYMMFSNPMHDDFVIDNKIIKAMEAIFIIHADHEQNASTSTVRIAGSSMANPFACVAAGIGSLWGPRHGGANEAVLNMLEQLISEKLSIN